ncbi:MAG: hypothetical protein KIC73_00515 [Clostridiales bacterium]|nr:hypothetical protein [Clostridiales bacterium]
MDNAYEKVSVVIAEEMNNAWKNIFDKFSGDTPVNFSESKFTQDELKFFLEELSIANLSIDFSPKEIKMLSQKSFGTEVIKSNENNFISGEISIGVNVRF